MTTFTTSEHPQHQSPRNAHRGLMAAAVGICSLALAAAGLSIGLSVAAAAPSTHANHTHVVNVVVTTKSVTALQEDLTALGYYGGGIDGIYGPQTAAAVTYLQRDAGLAQTGKLNAATEAALMRLLAHPSQQAVTTLQKGLAALNYYDGAIDGIYGNQTAAAVTYFQRDAGLAQTGKLNGATEAALMRFLVNGNNQMSPNM